MVNHLLETRHPLSSSAVRLCVAVAVPSFHSPYTLPSSVSRNPFVCHSYENTRGVGGYSSHFGTQRSHSSLSTAHYPLPTLFMYENTGGMGVFFPFWNAPTFIPFGPSDRGSAPVPERRSRPGPDVSTFCRAIIGDVASASAKKASRE